MENRTFHLLVAGMGGALVAVTIAGCAGERSHAEPELAALVARPAGFHLRVTGGRTISIAERAGLVPQLLQIPTLEQAGGEPLVGRDATKPADHADLAEPVDVSDLVIELVAEPAQEERAEAPMLQSLTGPVAAAQINYPTAYIAQGASVVYRLSGTISDAIVQPLNNDADLFSENCDNSGISSSRLTGTLADSLGVYNRGGNTTCRQFRVYGYRATNFRLRIFNYD